MGFNSYYYQFGHYYTYTMLCLLILHTDGDICYRRYVAKRTSCKGLVRKYNFSSPEECCRFRKAQGFASQQEKVEGRKNLYKCTPCSALNTKPPGDDPSRYDKVNYPFKQTLKTNGLSAGLNSWASWSRWTKCSGNCERGSQERYRKCITTNSTRCTGKSLAVRPCKVADCQDSNVSNWGSWGDWTSCTRTCNLGVTLRTRKCENITDTRGCDGSDYETKRCGERQCPVDGSWGSWSEFSPCSRTCGNGWSVRYRYCNSPSPSRRGRFCRGDNKEKVPCKEEPCPVDGSWSLWSRWSQCSASCGTGLRIRERLCDAPPPKFGGSSCEGPEEQTITCYTQFPCPVYVVWSSWGDWGECSGQPCSAEGMTRYRTRICKNQTAQNGGDTCPGAKSEQEKCRTNTDCSGRGNWCSWQGWSRCNHINDDGSNGIRLRRRVCRCPSPEHGQHCDGQMMEAKGCRPGYPCPSSNGCQQGNVLMFNDT